MVSYGALGRLLWNLSEQHEDFTLEYAGQRRRVEVGSAGC